MNEQIKEVFQKLVAIEENVPKNITIPEVPYYENKVNVISLFSGAGGLDLGLEYAGIEVGANREINFNDFEEYQQYKDQSVVETVYALDIFKEATQTFSDHFKNATMHIANIRNIKEFPKGDLMCFGFPCPGFVRP